ncbi:CoA-transferase [Orrella sp. 11846]|uniref:CoA-transferase n=1 Tax=Orrella sp. 11846 TaxID=3409913 RepID=UPI003B5A59E3
MTTVTPRERLIITIASLLDGARHVAVGASSPIPAAAAMLLRAQKEALNEPIVRLSILGSVKHNLFTNGSAELFDCAGQGRIDAFFLGGGQIDGQGNINLVGIGDYPTSKVRWPGSFGSAYLYFTVPKVILFREEHSARTLVEKVDFISAPGTSAPEVYRQGGPYALLTGKALFMFDPDKAKFRLKHIHPGFTLEDIREATGFEFDVDPDLCATPDADADTLALLRGRVLTELKETYPDFASQLTKEIASHAE